MQAKYEWDFSHVWSTQIITVTELEAKYRGRYYPVNSIGYFSATFGSKVLYGEWFASITLKNGETRETSLFKVRRIHPWDRDSSLYWYD